MAATDRQTDTKFRSSCWSVTAFNEDIPRLEDKENFPNFVKEVWGGRETAPTTGTLHFQGAVVCNTQVRFSALKKWLPQAHIEPAMRANCLKKYCMKEETAAGIKQVLSNPDKFLKFHDALIFLSRHVDYTAWISEAPRTWYNRACIEIFMTKPELAGLFANPTMRRLYEDTWVAWKYWSDKEKEGGPSVHEDSITPPAPEGTGLGTSTVADGAQGPTGTLEIMGCFEEHADAEECRVLLPRSDWCEGCEALEKRYPIL